MFIALYYWGLEVIQGYVHKVLLVEQEMTTQKLLHLIQKFN